MPVSSEETPVVRVCFKVPVGEKTLIVPFPTPAKTSPMTNGSAWTWPTNGNIAAKPTNSDNSINFFMCASFL